eukprot:symbB.v1.2.002853.t1/scaffold130.1/size334612/4
MIVKKQVVVFKICVATWALYRRRKHAVRSTVQQVRLRLLYASMTGTSQRCAETLAEELRTQVASQALEISIEDLSTFVFDNLLSRSSEVTTEIVVLLLSTHTDGVLPPSSAHFGTLLADHVHDFRVGRTAMQHLNFAVLGFGSSVYASSGHYCTAAVRADAAFASMGARRVARLVRVTDTREQVDQVATWKDELRAALEAALEGRQPAQARPAFLMEMVALKAVGVEGRAAAEAAVADSTEVEGDDASESEDESTALSLNATTVHTLFILPSPLEMPSKSTKRPWGMGPAVLFSRGNKKRRKAERPVEFVEEASDLTAESSTLQPDPRKDELQQLSHEELSKTYGLGYALLQRMGFRAGEALKPGALAAPLAARANLRRKGLRQGANEEPNVAAAPTAAEKTAAAPVDLTDLLADAVKSMREAGDVEEAEELLHLASFCEADVSWLPCQVPKNRQSRPSSLELQQLGSFCEEGVNCLPRPKSKKRQSRPASRLDGDGEAVAEVLQLFGNPEFPAELHQQEIFLNWQKRWQQRLGPYWPFVKRNEQDFQVIHCPNGMQMILPRRRSSPDLQAFLQTCADWCQYQSCNHTKRLKKKWRNLAKVVGRMGPKAQKDMAEAVEDQEEEAKEVEEVEDEVELETVEEPEEVTDSNEVERTDETPEDETPGLGWTMDEMPGLGWTMDEMPGLGEAEKAASDLEELAEGCASTKERPMLTSKHRAQLTKEGYKIVGSHSAVKLCRWTKHQLRGRGGCYKHSFYGITSYQCMEATPSLACANKCVFCWRHHKNPVGTEWKWSMDPPDQIVADGIDQHKRMIRECKGIPGVKKERFDEAMNVRHCALSLVGEPIMYPRINELVNELHKREISTFLVTNAQFPDAIRKLTPITQLYISVDAGTKETLKAVDRPLFTDFWPRYLDSMKALAEKKQRTVYRLTLVKGQNMEDAGDYAKLVALGKPDFIEIKSVTFCGESKASSLTISCTPWHEESFSEALLSKEGLEDQYELACEHQHSCIVLLANKKFKVDGQWHTWIDYNRFHELVRAGVQFDAKDYWAPTPDWALYGSEEAGFDPNETRVYHNRTKKKAQAGLLSEEQRKMSGAVHVSLPHTPAIGVRSKEFDVSVRPQAVRSGEFEVPVRPHAAVRQLAFDFLRRPVHVHIGEMNAAKANTDVTQHVVLLERLSDKDRKLDEMLSQHLGEDELAIIFVATKRCVQDIANLLWHHRFGVTEIHGDKDQRERDLALRSFTNKEKRVMIATDVASRGLDIKGVKLVINYDAANTPEDYVHRIGRTGRAGEKGLSYTFLVKEDPLDLRKAKAILEVMQTADQEIPEELRELVGVKTSRNFKGGGKGRGGKGGKKGGGGFKGGSKSHSKTAPPPGPLAGCAPINGGLMGGYGSFGSSRDGSR